MTQRSSFPQKALIITASIMILVVIAAMGLNMFLKALFKNLQHPAPAVKVSLIEQRPYHHKIRSTATLFSDNHTVIRSLVSAPIAAIYAHMGDVVQEGDLLIELDPRSAEATLEAAEAALSYASYRFEQNTVLFKDGALPEISFQESFSNVSQALSNKAAAQERLDDYRIKAPHDGVIGYIKWLGHDTILAGEEVLHLSSPTSNRLRASLSARSHAELKSGQKLTIDLPHGGALSATIDKIAPDLSAPQQRFFIEAALEEPLALPPGTEVAISLELPPNNTVLIVPADALDVNPLGPVVWVITETNEHFYAHPYPCQIISYSGTEVAITHPKLQAGEKVVILGGFKLIAGQEVIPYV